MFRLAAFDPVRVLIVEDEPYMAEAIQNGIRQEAIAAGIGVLDRDIPARGVTRSPNVSSPRAAAFTS